MSDNTRLAITREDKLTNKHGHLFVDTDGIVRDHFLEDMFNDCYTGRPLDAVFQNNFAEYFSHFSVRKDIRVPAIVFSDADEARSWVSCMFGPLSLRAVTATDRTIYGADALPFVAVLQTQITANRDACFAPTALHAALLAVVNAFRHASEAYTAQMLADVEPLN